MGLLSTDAVNKELASMEGWTFTHNTIHKKISFENYMAGIAFVNELAAIAEAKNHHPDLFVGWCNVGVTFTSHDQGGVTDQCIAMAKVVDALL